MEEAAVETEGKFSTARLDFVAGDDCALDIVAEVVAEGASTLRQKYLRGRAQPMAAAEGALGMLSEVAMCFVTHEEQKETEIRDNLVDSYA